MGENRHPRMPADHGNERKGPRLRVASLRRDCRAQTGCNAGHGPVGHYNIDFIGLTLLVLGAVAGLRMLGYVEFMPFIREMTSNVALGKKRKYFHYVIKRFRRDASKSRDLDEFRSHMTKLMQEYHFPSAEIILDVPHTANPFFVYTNGDDPERLISLSFPILTGKDNALGQMSIRKQMDNDHVVCMSEMVGALSGEVVSFLKRRELLSAG